jgi:diketogulonate reductase-like aldo/keto reductase
VSNFGAKHIQEIIALKVPLLTSNQVKGLMEKKAAANTQALLVPIIAYPGAQS